MSHYKIKSIGIKDNKVFLTGACNNIIPITYSRSEAPSLTQILVEQGRSALDVLILKEFQNGNFQGYGSPYGKAIIWRGLQENKGVDIPLDELMRRFKKAWTSKDAVSASYQGSSVVAVKRSRLFYNYDTSRQKLFKNITQAMLTLRGFDGISYHPQPLAVA